MQNLSDKLIDSQGNTATYSSGADSKLYYVDHLGQKSFYLTQKDVDEVKESDTVKLENNKFVRVTEPVTTFNLTFSSDIKNATILFETGELTTYGYTIEPGMFLNREFNFESYKVYYISCSNGVILWNELIEWA